MRKNITAIDITIIEWTKKVFPTFARAAFFVVFFYFGILKVLGFSPATPLAEALTTRTVGMEYFDLAFLALAVVECVIGVLFLIPKATRIVIPLLVVHLLTVCSPLVLTPDMVWSHPFVPNLEGQYIIKNIVLVAAAIGIVANLTPLRLHKK